jgi:A/G-specific adenine glycosylase
VRGAAKKREATRAAAASRRPPRAAPVAVASEHLTPAEVRAPLVAWYRGRKRDLPWRVAFAATRDPYVVWVSEIMLQQTVIKAVIPVYARFLARFPDVAALAAADEAEVREAVRGLGYYRRFRFLHLAARQVAATGAWPKDAQGWRALPGVGDYTAAAVASITLGEAVGVLDGNVERVLARLTDTRAPTDAPGLKKTFQALAHALVDPAAAGDFNQGMMELGQTVCTVASPRCDECPLAAPCLARSRASQKLAPAPKKGVAAVDVPMALVAFRRGDQVALIERPEAARFLRGTRGFLTVLGEAATCGDGFELPATLAAAIAQAREDAAGRVRHSITHHRIRADVVVLDDAKLPRSLAAEARFAPLATLETELVSNLDRKAWKILAAPPAAPGPLGF